MNPDLRFVFKRRSIRAYTDRPVSDQMVNDLLEAAMAAPSACAKDPWRFIVVRDKKRLAEIANGLPNGKMLSKAAVGIVVAGDLEAAHSGELSYLLQDCSAAIENMLLAAAALGLGACWLGVHPREDRIAHVRSLLKMPSSMLPVSAIAIGCPADNPQPRTRYRESSVFRETC
jgi:nitroreductase